jgi:hypothetical protein
MKAKPNNVSRPRVVRLRFTKHTYTFSFFPLSLKLPVSYAMQSDREALN